MYNLNELKNPIFAICGPSGNGKSHVIKSIMDMKILEHFNELISCTTREPRKGEVDGQDYFFINKDKFLTLKETVGFFEDAEYDGNYYGTSNEELYQKLSKGPVFNILDHKGYLTYKEKYHKTIGIFIYTTYDLAKLQMANRGDSDSNIQSRIAKYNKEMSYMNQYDYVIHNEYNKVEDTIEIVKKIIEVKSK